MKNNPNQLRNSYEYAKKKLQKTEFLEELLDSEQPRPEPAASAEVAAAAAAKPAISSNIINQVNSVSSVINESQPLLFDKYLVSQF